MFIRNSYREIFIGSVKFCQQKKGRLVGAWVIMTSHVHMIIGSNGNNLEDIIRDMKSFTSRHIRKEVEQAAYESRREWMLQMFYKEGRANTNNKDYRFWIQSSHPVQIDCSNDEAADRLHSQ